MGLFQNAIETYDMNVNLVGKYEGKEPLCPIGHIIAKPNIEITIDERGKYISAATVKNDDKIIIPATEDSAGRSGSKIAPHPLCDQVKYLCSLDGSEEAKKAYLENLKEWIDSEYSDDKLKAVYEYISAGTILGDLKNAGLLKFGKNNNIENEKDLVVWNVLGCGDCSKVYEDKKLMEKFSSFVISRDNSKEKGLCFITGEKEELAAQHLKGVFSIKGNAKLISSNDSANFTYRGRFNTAKEALSIGYISSQKAHNALKWIAANQRVIYGNRCFICWSPQGDAIPKLGQSLLMNFLKLDIPDLPTPTDYKNELQKALMGYKSGIKDRVNSKTVVVSFDAATTGRLAVTFYSEMLTSDFFDRLEKWDQYCMWYANRGKTVISPPISKIVEYAFGVERDSDVGKIEVNDDVAKEMYDRVLRCRIGEELFPLSIKKKLVEKASKLYLYGRKTREGLLETTCSVIRKYYYDYKKEDLSMSLDKEKRDLSYQFGRLLAVYEKIERDTFEDNSTREPNAMRIQPVYCNQPMHYANELEKQMEKAYLPRLSVGKRVFYKNLIGEIMNQISEFSENEWNKALKDTYLIGYYLQRRDLYSKKEKSENKDEEV